VPVLVLALVHAFYGVPLSAYRPFFNDEVAYWHQASTFSRAGFDGGYYTLDEATNPSGVTPFGPHGPGFAVLYGAFGAIFGWYRHTAVVLNLVAIGVAAWIWVSLTRVSIPRLLLATVLLLTFWHMLFWAPTGMQESLHHAGALVLAGCFASALGPSSRWWITALGWITVAMLSFIRPSWMILLPLWAVAITRKSSRVIAVATVAASLFAGGAILFAYSRTAAPYEEGFFFLRATSLSLGVKSLLDNVTANVQRLRIPDEFHRIELLERYQYGALLLATLVTSVVAMWKRRDQAVRLAHDSTPHVVITAAALAMALIAMLLLYQFTNYAEHRVLSAFLLFGAMLCLAAPGRIGPALAAVIIISGVVSTKTMIVDLEDAWRPRFVWDRRSVAELERALDGTMAYHPEASRWCNTLLTSQYPPQLIAVPAGIGLSVVRKPEKMMLPPRSRYILLDDGVRAAFTSALNLEMIATLPYGTFYVNHDARCGTVAANVPNLSDRPRVQ
jgi:hypothetical protein